MSREQLSLAVREAKSSDEKIHAPGKLGRVRIINQELSVAISLGLTFSLLAFLRMAMELGGTAVEKIWEGKKSISTKEFDGSNSNS